MIVNNIKYINPHKPGGKYGSIKDANGVQIMVPPDLLPLFRLGMTCEVTTKEQVWNRGTPDEGPRTIATTGPTPIQGNTGIQGAVPQAHGTQVYQAANQGPANQRPNTGFQPRVIQGGPVGTDPNLDRYNKSNLDQARHIFITGVVGRAMGSGKFSASEILVLTQAAGEAYDRLLDRTRPAAAPPTPQHTLDQMTAPSPPLGMEPGDPGPELQ